MHQPGQHRAVLAALVEPAVDQVAAQPFDDGRHQQLQAGDGALLRLTVQVVQRQQLEHQVARAGVQAQLVQQGQRVAVEVVAGHDARAAADTLPAQLLAQRRLRADHGLQRTGQLFRYLKFHGLDASFWCRC
jgi:hypothetical protein